MHNFSIDDTVNSVNYVYRDTYTFETDIEPQEKYKVRYCVKTINNYEIQSEEYTVALVHIEDVRQIMDLVAENDFDNGYITLKFKLSEEMKNKIARNNNLWPLGNNYYAELLAGALSPIRNHPDIINAYEAGKVVLYTGPSNIGDVSELTLCNKIPSELRFSSLSDNFYRVININHLEDFIAGDYQFEPLSILLERASDIEDFSSWQRIDIINLKNAYELSNFVYKDYSIEQGMFYQYRLAICDKKGYVSSYSYSNLIYSDFEDMFLYDGEKQIKIRFNPKVSSFKQTILE